MALVIFAALNSVLSLAYYIPLVSAVYKQQPSVAVQQGQPLPFSMTLPLVLLGLAIFVLGVLPGLVTWLTEPAGAAVVALMGR